MLIILMNQINLNKAIGAFFASTAAGAKSAPALGVGSRPRAVIHRFRG
jgi:hypothetical protein